MCGVAIGLPFWSHVAWPHTVGPNRNLTYRSKSLGVAVLSCGVAGFLVFAKTQAVPKSSSLARRDSGVLGIEMA